MDAIRRVVDVDVVVGRQKMSLIEIAARFGLMAKPNRRNSVLGACKEHLNAKAGRFIIHSYICLGGNGLSP
jgi:hypothetical protein